MRKRWLTRGATGLVALALAATAAVVTPGAAYAGANNNLCHSDGARGSVPDKFPIDACIGGDTAYFVNTLDFPLIVSVTGDSVGDTQRVKQLGGAMPSAIFSVLAPHDPRFVPPGYEIKVKVGKSGAHVSLSDTKDLTQGYAIVAALWKYAPGLEQAKTGADFITELVDVSRQARTCLDTNNNWGDIGCRALYLRNISFAIGRAGLTIAAGPVTGMLLNVIDAVLWSDEAAGDALKVRHGVIKFDIKAAPAPPPPPANNNTSSDNSQPANNGGSGNQGAPANHNNPPPPPAQPATRQVVIQNKVLNGPTDVIEGNPQIYFSTELISVCRLKGCMVGGSSMGSGTVITVDCWRTGQEITNQNLNTTSDDGNPWLATSTRWYHGSYNGMSGWINEIWLRADGRGGLGLPQC